MPSVFIICLVLFLSDHKIEASPKAATQAPTISGQTAHDNRERCQDLVNTIRILEQRHKSLSCPKIQYSFLESQGCQKNPCNLQQQNGGANQPGRSKFSGNPKHCADVLASGIEASGISKIYPYSCCPKKAVSVYCDQLTDGGGWTAIQRRIPSERRVRFDRSWEDYKHGFGNLSAEFWLGLEHMHAMTTNAQTEIRIDLEDFAGEKAFIKYGKFEVGNSESNYRLTVGRQSGDGGDSLRNHNGSPFSTYDRDNDASSKSNCAEELKGGWWFKCEDTMWSYQDVFDSNLNGLAHNGKYRTYPHKNGIVWLDWKGLDYSLKKTSMKIRPKL